MGFVAFISVFYGVWLDRAWLTPSVGNIQRAAEAALEQGMAEGGWVYLQKVHLVPRWLPTLDSMLEAAAESASVNPDFRSGHPSPQS